MRNTEAHLDLKARLANHREAQADSITALSHANDSTEFVHRHFERSRIDKLGGCGPMGAAYGRGLKTLGSYSTGGSEEEFLGDEVRGQIGLWAATGRFWYVLSSRSSKW